MRSNLRLLIRLGAKRRLPALVGLAAMALVGAAFEVVGVGLVFPLIALVLDPGLIAESSLLSWAYELVGASSPRQFIGMLAFVMVAVLVTRIAYMAVLRYLELRVLTVWALETSRRLMAGYLCCPYRTVLSRNSAGPVRTVASLVPKVFNGFVGALLLLTVNGIVAVGLAAVTIAIEPKVAIVAIAAPLLYLPNRMIGRRLARLGALATELSRKRQKALQQSFGALKEIKALGREAYFLDRFAAIQTRLLHNGRRARFTKLVPPMITEAILIVVVVTLIVLMLTAGQSAENTLASLGVIAAASFRLAPITNRIFAALNTIRHSEHSARIIASNLADADQLPHARRDVAERSRFHLLQLEGVSFSYPESGRPSLHDIDLVVQAGERLGLAGPSGAGKTTLVDILLGLFDPDSGSLLLDGVPIRVRSREWREAVAYVPQSIYILDDAVRQNVAFGMPDEEIEDERVWRALEEARLAEHVRLIPGGLDATLGEHGARLSAGQRQRIGIARALYRDPDLLVLDEATSHLDEATESEIADTIRALDRHKTVIVVAHRRSTLELCDRIVFLREGRIERIGTASDWTFGSDKVRPPSASVVEVV